MHLWLFGGSALNIGMVLGQLRAPGQSDAGQGLACRGAHPRPAEPAPLGGAAAAAATHSQTRRDEGLALGLRELGVVFCLLLAAGLGETVAGSGKAAAHLHAPLVLS